MIVFKLEINNIIMCEVRTEKHSNLAEDIAENIKQNISTCLLGPLPTFEEWWVALNNLMISKEIYYEFTFNRLLKNFYIFVPTSKLWVELQFYKSSLYDME